MQKSSDFIRGCIEEFKEKCAISVIPIAFAKIIRICNQSHNTVTTAKWDK